MIVIGGGMSREGWEILYCTVDGVVLAAPHSQMTTTVESIPKGDERDIRGRLTSDGMARV